ncbi:hypothetical protein GGG16DRAFT_47889 [Schizophyllum commune]
MHLVFENVMKQLILLWTDKVEGLSLGSTLFHLADFVWQAIGEATAKSGAYIPSVFTGRPPNCAEPKGAATADSWSFWLLYLGPRLLARHFKSEVYYRHFVRLSQLVHKCLQFELSGQDICDIREGFQSWVEDFERLYYQYQPERVSICTINIHALLHIADSIEAMGPVWTYWAFPMERYCGKLQRMMRSRRFPWSNLDAQVLANAQLDHIKLRYNIDQELSLKPAKAETVRGQFSHRDYESYVLLPKCLPSSTITPTMADRIVAHLATRYDMTKHDVSTVFSTEYVTQYATVRRLEGGDEMHAAALLRRHSRTGDDRDRTFIKANRNQNFRNRPIDPYASVYYARLLNIFVVSLPCAVAAYMDESRQQSSEPTVLILAHIQTCKTTGQVDPFCEAPVYKQLSTVTEVVDICTVQCLVGRTPLVTLSSGGTEWCIVDRSSDTVMPIFEGSD